MIRRLENSARNRLEAGDVALGVGIVQGRVVDIAAIMKTSGYDWLFLDLEHGAMSVDAAAQLSVAGNSVGIAPIVRVPVGGYGLAARLLDGGAMGIVLPHVETKAEAEELVDIARFPPTGHRGVGGVIPQFDYEPVSLGEAVVELNRTMLLTVMVETPEAIERVDEIAAVEGIDVVMIGTNDLAMAMGHPQEFGHPEVVEAYEAVTAACAKHGKWAGSGGVRVPELAAKYIGMGARFFLAGQDVGFMMAGARERADLLRKAAAKG